MKKLVQCDISDVSSILETIEARLALLLSIDSTFSVELSVCRALQGKQGDQLVEKEILARLPTAQKTMALGSAVASLKSLRESTMCKWTGDSAGNVLAAVIEQLVIMMKGQPAKMEHFSSEFMQLVRARLPFFCTHYVEKSGNAKAHTLVGEKAAPAKLKNLEARIKDGSADLASVDDLHTFEWLLTAAEKNKLKDVTAKLVAATTKKFVKKKGKAEAKKAQKAEKNEEESLADVFALFVGTT